MTTLHPPAIAAREAAALLPTYARRAVEFASGHGAWLVDEQGREYLDALAGLAVVALGHAHPEVADAVAAQARTLVHTSNLFYTRPQVELAEALADKLAWPDAKAFFGNSGAEANEGALKLARRHGKAQHPDKVHVVALEGSFHGRTLAALLATGNPAKHTPFEPLGRWITHVPPDDPDALTAAVDERTCAVILEVVQGEGGVRPVPPATLHAAREACDRVGALLIYDEVQTGFGRLGSWFGWQAVGVEPDVVALAKAMANGLPAGAVVAHGPATKAFGPGDHASTFGGGPVIAQAALTVLRVLERDGLVARAAEAGALLRGRLDALTGAVPFAAGARGMGLLLALQLDAPVASEAVDACLAAGLVVNDVAPDALRFAPPLVITDEEIDVLIERLSAALHAVADTRGRQAR